MFRQRALVAVIGLPVLYGLIILDGFRWALGLPLLVVVVVVSMLGAEEFRRMLLNRGFHPPKDLGLMMGALPPLFLYFYHYDYHQWVLLLLTLAIVLDVLMVAFGLIADISHRVSSTTAAAPEPKCARGKNGKPEAAKPVEPPPPGGTLGALRDFFLQALGSLYIGGTLSYLIFLRRLDDHTASPWNVWPVALIIAVIWIADTAAFAAGKLLNGPKLCPRVSPGKTIAGTLAGIAASVLVFVLVALASREHLLAGIPLPMMAAVGAIVGVAGLCGDLTESVIKRWAQVKDSGNILLAHGGIFDRFDSLMWAAPAFYYLLCALLSGR